MTNNGSNPIKPPFWLLLELTYQCPLHCPYCSNPIDLGSKDQELSTEQWFDVLEQGRELGAVQLGLSGGEPLMRKDLTDIVAHAHDLGYYINLITSGIGLTQSRIDGLKQAGLDHIQISLQAADPEMSDAIAGKKNAFQHKVNMAKAVKEAGFPMVLNAVITRQNIHNIESIMALSCELNADYVELATSQYYGWALENRASLLPSKAEIEQAEYEVNAFRDACDRNAPKFIFVTPDYYEERPKPCMSGWGSIFTCVAPDGKVLPCHSAAVLDLPFLNVKNRSLKHIWYESESFNAFRGFEWMEEPCKSCDEKESDFGGCRCQAMLLTGSATATDPVCSKSPHHHKITDAIFQASSGCHNELVMRHMRNSQTILMSKP
ncbi:pyrroloquinoline quinone biosynthesis protein PqqE [Vibrio penaeicida]|uniref:PqqA peptide cyclase n=1 Tax=Vibrio penaeicida TaxID=104609 RepID=A0AAV5NUC0_9VIBR|nr:pyrroloquinoline quinone biosynthesis protein PqqE [Vibrio penaeicida]RTZ20444.1 pyrroloquinoline quinone biosynthesis protein PqqE [Vibrio penaeicida]GLQ73606.1 coenzyme PQQ synthesis protein E [Vibrio penaeicida]